MGIVRDFDEKNFVATVEQRGKFEVNTDVEFFQPHEKTFRQKISKMFDDDDKEIFSAPHAQQLVKIPVEKKVEKFSLMRGVMHEKFN